MGKKVNINPLSFTFKWEMPEGLFSDDISVHQCDNLQTNIKCDYGAKGFPTIDSSVELNIELVDWTDELNSSKSVRNWMDEWIELVANSKEFREVEGTILEFFEIDDNDDNDATHTNWIIKKPISEMTDDEKLRLKRLLTENFRIKEEELKKICL